MQSERKYNNKGTDLSFRPAVREKEQEIMLLRLTVVENMFLS